MVYRATELALDRTVALKLITQQFSADPDFRARFWREARLAASLEHPSVLPIYKAGEGDGLSSSPCAMSRAQTWRAISRAGGSSRPAPSRCSPRSRKHLTRRMREGSSIEMSSRRISCSSVRATTNEPSFSDFGLAKVSNSNTGLTRDR